MDAHLSGYLTNLDFGQLLYSLFVFNCGQSVYSNGPLLLSNLVAGVGDLHNAGDRIVAALLCPEHLLNVGALVFDKGQALRFQAVVAQSLGIVNLFLQEGQPNRQMQKDNDKLAPEKCNL